MKPILRFGENIPTKTRYKCNAAYYTFVALDSNGRPKPSPELLETAEEKDRYEGALKRREMRLVLAGRLDPNKATDLKTLFSNQ